MDLITTTEENEIIDINNNDKIDELNEIDVEIKINKMNNLLLNAKKLKDYNEIIRQFNIKIKKDNQLKCPIKEKIKLKDKIIIIKFTIHEPEDVFDYDYFSNKSIKKKTNKK